MWEGRELEQKVANALNCISKGAAVLSEAGTTVYAMSNTMQKQGLSGLLQPEVWKQDPKPAPRVAKSTSIVHIEPADTDENRAILKLRLEWAMKDGDMSRVQRISRELDTLEGAIPAQTKADARMDATHPTAPSHRPFVAPTGQMYNIHAMDAAHSVQDPKPDPKQLSAGGVTSRRDGEGGNHTSFRSQPMESSQTSSAARSQLSSTANLQGTPYAYPGSMPYSHPCCCPMRCPHMNPMYGLHYGECQSFLFRNNNEAGFPPFQGQHAAFIPGVSQVSMGEMLASTYHPDPCVNHLAITPLASSAPSSAIVSMSQSTPRARVEEPVDFASHMSVRDQPQMQQTVCADTCRAPSWQPLELPIVVPMSAAASVSRTITAEDAPPSSGMLLLETRTKCEPDAPEVPSRPTAIASTPEAAVKEMGNPASDREDHRHVEQAVVASNAETPQPLGAPLQDIYEVETVLAMRQTEIGKREFLIKWKGWGPTWNNWEPEEHIMDRRMLRKFNNKRPAAESASSIMDGIGGITVQSKRRCAKQATVRARTAAREENEQHDKADGEFEDTF